MSAARLEHKRISARTRRAQGVSMLAHLILLMWLVLQPHVFPEPPTVTEITWIDPESLMPAAPPPAPARSPQVTPRTEPQPGQVKPQRDKQFERTLRRAEKEPTPQTSRTIQDLLNRRVATLQRQETEAAPVRPLALNAPTPQAGMQLAEVGDSPRSAPVDLKRDKRGSKPVPLVRSGTGLPSNSLPQLATVGAPKMDARPSKPQDVERANVSDLAGASLMGPIADRPVVHYQSPLYPDWAEFQGVEASVSLYFVVRPDGRIKENILVEKTSGFEDFDANAVSALRTWRFQELGAGSSGEQWGRITFHYRLSSG